MKPLKVRLTLLEEMLGTSCSDKDIHREYIASKSPDAATIEDEVAALGIDEVVAKGTTIFPKTDDGRPFVYDYQIKGFFKDACSSLARVPGTASNKLKAFRKIIDGLVFVAPRKIPFTGNLGPVCSRPIRANGPQGERVAIASSETVAPGSTIEFDVTLLDPSHEKLLLEWLAYGAFRGIGQWRNSGKGRFSFEIL